MQNKKLLIISESEKRRILEMHYKASNKKYIVEQNESEPVIVKIGDYKIVGETESTLIKCSEVYVEGSFPALDTTDNSKAVAKFQQKLLESINADETLKKSLEDGALSINKIKLVGGASNIMNGKTTPYEMNNNREISDPGPDEKFNVNKDNQLFKDNKQLAVDRANNFLNSFKTTILPNLNIKENFENPVVEGYVINTGGVPDSKRTSDYSNPGQVVMITMSVCGTGLDKQTIINCFADLKIEVSYDRTRDDLNKPVNHICNNATYEIYGNGILLKNVNGTNYADLNNGKGSKDYNQYNKKDPSVGNRKRGGSRKSEFIIDELTAKDFVNFDNYSKYNGDLAITVKCVNPKNINDKRWGYGCHSSATLIKVLKSDGTPVDKPEYIGTPPGNKDTEKNLVTVAACKGDVAKNEEPKKE